MGFTKPYLTPAYSATCQFSLCALCSSHMGLLIVAHSQQAHWCLRAFTLMFPLTGYLSPDACIASGLCLDVISAERLSLITLCTIVPPLSFSISLSCFIFLIFFFSVSFTRIQIPWGQGLYFCYRTLPMLFWNSCGVWLPAAKKRDSQCKS